MSKLTSAGLVFAALFGLGGSAYANPVVSGFDNLGTVPKCDDCYTAGQSLGFSANFFGNSYSQLYISNNGYVTFGAGQGTYTPYGIGSGYTGNPIIAPFFADVDTRAAGGGSVTYGSGSYAGRNAFGVTWNAVGYYGLRTDKLDTFQLILVDQSSIGAGDFDIYFNYGQIQWETGSASGGANGLGGTSAAVGYSNGSGLAGTYDQFPGSLIPGSFLDGGPYALVSGSNDGVTGQYLFQVRNGQVTPPTNVPEPASIALAGIALLGLAGARRRKKSRARRLTGEAKRRRCRLFAFRDSDCKSRDSRCNLSASGFGKRQTNIRLSEGKWL